MPLPKLVFIESHNDAKSRSIMNELIPGLKEKGYNTFIEEMMIDETLDSSHGKSLVLSWIAHKNYNKSLKVITKQGYLDSFKEVRDGNIHNFAKLLAGMSINRQCKLILQYI